MNFSPFPSLFTERLILREIILSVSFNMFLLRSDPIVTNGLDKLPFNKVDEAKDFIAYLKQAVTEHKGIRWVICLKEDNKLISRLGFYRFAHRN